MIDKFSLSELATDKLYKKLQAIKQPVFPDDYKLVIDYHSDISNNENYPGKKLEELVRFLSELDIPAPFVYLRTSFVNIDRDLTHLDSIFHNGKLNVIPTKTLFNLNNEGKDTYCVAPWVHFYFNPQGQINPCCVADINYPLGNYLHDSIDVNAASMVNFRQELLNGIEPAQCTGCYAKESMGLRSARQTFNTNFEKYKSDSAIVNEFKLRLLDVRLSNICNLKCRMCDGKFSSRIAEEDFQLYGKSEFLNTGKNPAADKILQIAKEHINNLEVVYFAGGEPLIDEHHYEILDLILANNRNDMQIRYNTNLSILKYKQKNVLNYWGKLSNVTIGASIDLIGSAANYVRNGVEYAVIEQNADKVLSTCPHVNFTITSTLSLYNVFNLCDLQKHWLNKINAQQIEMSILTGPDYLSIQVLPEAFKAKAVKRINEHINLLMTYENSEVLVSKWQDAKKFMLSADTSYRLPLFFINNDVRDSYRNQIFEDFFPEYADLRAASNSKIT